MMTLDKTFLLWAAMFVIGFAFGDGGLVPNDPVFDCLQGTSYDAMECYHDGEAHEFSGAHRGRVLGKALGRLLPKHISAWPNMNNTQRAQKCLTSLMNFVEPLKVVLASQKQPDFVCTPSGNSLNKTLHGLLRVLETAIKDIDIYARRHSIAMKPLRLKSVDMTRMTSLALKQLSGAPASKAVILRNHVFLGYLKQVVSNIKMTPRSCFNTKVQFTDVCPV